MYCNGTTRGHSPKRVSGDTFVAAAILFHDFLYGQQSDVVLVGLFEVLGVPDHLTILPPQDHGSRAALDLTLESQGPTTGSHCVTQGLQNGRRTFLGCNRTNLSVIFSIQHYSCTLNFVYLKFFSDPCAVPLLKILVLCQIPFTKSGSTG